MSPTSSMDPFFIGGALVLAGFLFFRSARKYMQKWLHDKGGSEEPAFTLQDLRKMRDDGMISPGEYDRMRSAMLGASGAKATLARPAGDPTGKDEAA